MSDAALIEELETLEATALDAADEAAEDHGLAAHLFEQWAHVAYVIRLDLTGEGDHPRPTLMEYLDERGRT